MPIFSQNSKKSEDAAIVKELFAPGPVKDFDDFDYKAYDAKPRKKSKSSTSDKSISSDQPKNIEEPKARRRIKDRPSRPTQAKESNKKLNLLNGVPLGSNLDEFDVIGGSDLFRGAQGYQDDRYEIMHILTTRLWCFYFYKSLLELGFTTFLPD